MPLDNMLELALSDLAAAALVVTRGLAAFLPKNSHFFFQQRLFSLHTIACFRAHHILHILLRNGGPGLFIPKGVFTGHLLLLLLLLHHIGEGAFFNLLQGLLSYVASEELRAPSAWILPWRGCF